MEDIEDMLSNWSGFLRQFDYSKIKPKIYSNARAIAMGRLKDLMLREAQRAISKVEEFQYEPLEKQLLENLSRREHYRISPDLSTVELLDKSVIGTFGDLIEGARYAARATGAVGGVHNNKDYTVGNGEFTNPVERVLKNVVGWKIIPIMEKLLT